MGEYPTNLSDWCCGLILIHILSLSVRLNARRDSVIVAVSGPIQMPYHLLLGSFYPNLLGVVDVQCTPEFHHCCCWSTFIQILFLVLWSSTHPNPAIVVPAAIQVLWPFFLSHNAHPNCILVALGQCPSRLYDCCCEAAFPQVPLSKFYVCYGGLAPIQTTQLLSCVKTFLNPLLVVVFRCPSKLYHHCCGSILIQSLRLWL